MHERVRLPEPGHVFGAVRDVAVALDPSWRPALRFSLEPIPHRPLANHVEPVLGIQPFQGIDQQSDILLGSYAAGIQKLPA